MKPLPALFRSIYGFLVGAAIGVVIHFGCQPAEAGSGRWPSVGATSTATPSTNGLMSSTDKGYLDYLSGRWEVVQERFLISKLTQLTGFEYQKFGAYPFGAGSGMFTGALAVEGGAGSQAAASAAAAMIHLAPFVQTAKTGKWGVCWYAKFGAPTAAKVAYVGLINSHTVAGSRKIVFGTDNAVSATNYVLVTATASEATSVAADANYHTFCLTGDATTLTEWIDGASAKTQTVTALTDEPLADCLVNTTAGDAVATKILSGFIQP